MKLDELLKKFGLDQFLGKAKDDLGEEQLIKKRDSSWSESSNALIKAMMGSIGFTGDPYFPPDLIGGTCPRIPGEEEEIVWNAAAEACDTERVHVVWQAFENRIWYLAVKSAELSSHPNAWCPLGALLPTMKDASDFPVCYTYFGEEIAVLMIVTADGLQIFRGTTPVVRAKAERTAREIGQAPIVDITQEKVDSLTPIPWYSASLFEDRARRVLATVSVLASLIITGISFFVWLLANMSLIAIHHDISAALDATEKKSLQLVRMAEGTRTSPLRAEIEKFLSINDSLIALNGYLNVYEIKEGQVRWKAVVPPSATADRITAMGGKDIDASDNGVSIGNDAEIKYELEKKR